MTVTPAITAERFRRSVVDMLGAVDGVGVDWDGFDLLLHEIRHFDLVRHFIRLEDLDFLLDRDFDVFDFRYLLDGVLVVDVIRNIRMDVLAENARTKLTLGRRGKGRFTYT